MANDSPLDGTLTVQRVVIMDVLQLFAFLFLLWFVLTRPKEVPMALLMVMIGLLGIFGIPFVMTLVTGG
jgi:hypothetical protein